MKHSSTVPKPPDAWLGIIREADGSEWVYQISDSTKSRELLELVGDFENFPYVHERSLVIAKDAPSLRIRMGGITISSPASLSARDIWFERWAAVLEPHLRDPRRAQVFTFAPGRLSDPRATFHSTPKGPCPFPKDAEWPTCGYCGSRLAFVCALDFRFTAKLKLPGTSLVYHLCQECGPCSDDPANRMTWLSETDEVVLLGDGAEIVDVATKWEATDYPTLAHYAEEIDGNIEFCRETQIYFNFSCFGDKIGGHVFWIQNDDTPLDSAGEPMAFIGQTSGSRDIEIGDCGLVYFFFSEKTQETKMAMQYF